MCGYVRWVIVDHPELIAGRYRVDQPLGAGGMGTVYAGHDLRLDRDVAVKVLRDDLTRDPSLRHRFEREARAAARVTHPHVVAVYDTGEDAECDIFIVMERLTGRTLAHELADGPLDEARLRQVADAVLGRTRCGPRRRHRAPRREARQHPAGRRRNAEDRRLRHRHVPRRR